MDIRSKKGISKTVDYLSVDAVSQILQEPDPNSSSGIRDLAVLSLLYESGCRVQELIDLKYGDIIQQKTQNQLSVPFSRKTGDAIADYILNARGKSDLPYIFLKKSYCDSAMTLMNLTQNYLTQIVPIFPDSKAMFVDLNRNSFSQSVHQYLFEHCRDGLGIKAAGTRPPNLYSFRHSFATHRICQWQKDGKDIDALLPGLSAYMGHSRYSHTLYYLHLLPEIFSDMAGFDFERFSDIIPEVDSHE